MRAFRRGFSGLTAADKINGFNTVTRRVEAKAIARKNLLIAHSVQVGKTTGEFDFVAINFRISNRFRHNVVGVIVSVVVSDIRLSCDTIVVSDRQRNKLSASIATLNLLVDHAHHAANGGVEFDVVSRLDDKLEKLAEKVDENTETIELNKKSTDARIAAAAAN